MRYSCILFAGLLAAGLSASPASGSIDHHHRHRAGTTYRSDAALDTDDSAAPSVESMSGTWVVSNHGDAYRDVKAILRRDGTFHFRGAGWSSSGKFHIRGHSLCLDWCEIDGEDVDPGTVKKAYEIDDDCGSFTIDNYRYRRLDDDP